MRRLLMILPTLFLATVAQGQLPLPAHVLPLVCTASPGQEYPLRSELTVVNLGAAPAGVGLAFFGEGAPGVWTGAFASTTVIPPGEGRELADSVASVAGGRRGWLLVGDATPIDCTAQDRPYPALLAVSSRIRAAASATEVPASWLNLNISQVASVIAGMPGPDSPGRIEVGVANISVQPMTVRIVSRGSGGELLGQADEQLSPLALGLWRLEAMRLPPPPRGGRVEVSLLDSAGAWDPCRVASSQPPCIDPCDPKACPQRFGFPGFPAFFAFALLTGADGSVRYVPALVDQVRALRSSTEHRQRNCQEAGGMARLVDVFTRLALLRDPRTIGPRPSPAATAAPQAGRQAQSGKGN